MSTPIDQGSSTRPYLLRALHDWCIENGFTPFIAVHVDASVQVPAEYVKNNEIVLNVGLEAASSLSLGNETIEFKARFGGVVREIVVPVDHVVAIYARENGQGMAFPMPPAVGAAPGRAPSASPDAPGTIAQASTAKARAPQPRSAQPSPSSAQRPQAPRGLRLAREGGEGPERQMPAPSGPPSDLPPRKPGTPRPSLKRVK